MDWPSVGVGVVIGLLVWFTIWIIYGAGVISERKRHK